MDLINEPLLGADETRTEAVNQVGDAPDFFTDGAKSSFNQVSVSILFTRSRPTFDNAGVVKYEYVGIARMSPQQAAQVHGMLTRILTQLQSQLEEEQARQDAAAKETPSEIGADGSAPS